jgi:hypothetical protein
MTAVVGFPLGTIYQITNISQDFPGVVTLSTVADPNSFAVAIGQTVTISKVKGMNQLNGNRFLVSRFDPIAKTFELYTIQGDPVNTSSFIPYISGGEINIVSYPPPAGQPPGLMYNNQ